MGRPKKHDADKVRQSIIDAFWEQLKIEPLDKIVIKEIISKAGCSRTIFYYYFDNIYDLMDKAIEQEIYGDIHIAPLIFSVLTEEKVITDVEPFIEPPARRLYLATQQGGVQNVIRAMTKIVSNTWCQIFECEPKDLKPAVNSIINYEVAGLVAVIDSTDFEEIVGTKKFVPRKFVVRLVPVLMESICEEQGVPLDLVKKRLKERLYNFSKSEKE